MTQIKDDVIVVKRVQGLLASNRISLVYGSSAVHLSDSTNDRPEWRPNPILHQIRAIVNSPGIGSQLTTQRPSH